MTERVLYHVTPLKNLPGILHLGLIARPEPYECRNDAEQDTPVVFLFPSWDELEDAMMSWLADKFDDDEALTVLEVRIPPTMEQNLRFDPAVGFEVRHIGSIPPLCISVSKHTV